MQYFKPLAATQFVGDCMPFFHNGTFHLFYLLDEEHHQARNGFGGHQLLVLAVTGAAGTIRILRATLLDEL